MRAGLKVDGPVIVWPQPPRPDDPRQFLNHHHFFLPDPDYDECERRADEIKARWVKEVTAFAEAAERSWSSLDLGVAGLIVSGYSGDLRLRVLSVVRAEILRLYEESGRLAARADELTDLVRRGLVPTDDFYRTIDDWRERADAKAAQAKHLEHHPVRVGGRWVLRGLGHAGFGLGLAQDLRDGESLPQAATSQGVAALGGSAAGTTAAAVVSPAGPIASAVAFVAVGTTVAVLGDKGTDWFLERGQDKEEAARQRAEKEKAERREAEQRRIQRILEHAR